MWLEEGNLTTNRLPWHNLQWRPPPQFPLGKKGGPVQSVGQLNYGSNPKAFLHITRYDRTRCHADLNFYRIKNFLFINSCLMLLSRPASPWPESLRFRTEAALVTILSALTRLREIDFFLTSTE